MKFLFLSDSYKGSLSSREVNAILAREARRIFPHAECECIEIADGGEGTLEAFLALEGGQRVTETVSDPLGRQRSAAYAVIGDTALIAMAEASGLPLLSESERDPTKTTSYGTGELIRAALLAGYRKITVAIGGSATNDGGIGAMSALGIRFLDAAGRELSPVGASLSKICRIDRSALMPEACEARFTVMCDVENPLCGDRGATRVFGAQKGASPEMLDSLEDGMQNYAAVLSRTLGLDPQTIRGGGAAGGLGAALALFLDAEMRSGIEVLLDAAALDARLADTDAVFTGEGRIDRQSAYGKVISGIAKRTKRAGKPLFCIAGSIGEGAEALYPLGVTAMLPIISHPMPLSEAIANAEALLSRTAESLFRTIAAFYR